MCLAAQLDFVDLSDRGLRNLIHDLDGRRNLVFCKIAGAVRQQLIRFHGRGVFQNHVSHDDFAAIMVGNADGGGFFHGRTHVQHVLDLARVDVIAADDDHVVLTAANEEIAVIVDLSDVSRIEPSIAQRFRALLRPVAVAGHQLGTTCANFPMGTARQDLAAALDVDDLDFRFGNRNADRAGLANSPDRIGREDRPGLALPVAFVNRATDHALPLLERLLRQR